MTDIEVKEKSESEFHVKNIVPNGSFSFQWGCRCHCIFQLMYIYNLRLTPLSTAASQFLCPLTSSSDTICILTHIQKQLQLVYPFLVQLRILEKLYPPSGLWYVQGHVHHSSSTKIYDLKRPVQVAHLIEMRVNKWGTRSNSSQYVSCLYG